MLLTFSACFGQSFWEFVPKRMKSDETQPSVGHTLVLVQRVGVSVAAAVAAPGQRAARPPAGLGSAGQPGQGAREQLLWREEPELSKHTLNFTSRAGRKAFPGQPRVWTCQVSQLFLWSWWEERERCVLPWLLLYPLPVSLQGMQTHPRCVHY